MDFKTLVLTEDGSMYISDSSYYVNEGDLIRRKKGSYLVIATRYANDEEIDFLKKIYKALGKRIYRLEEFDFFRKVN